MTMRRTPVPYDIRAMCDECGMDLCDLSRDTGIPEHTLLAFARGEVALSAEDRLGMFVVLEDTSRALPDECAPWRRKRHLSRAEQAACNLAAIGFRKLCAEYDEEAAQQKRH
jgi:hypothetical protein